MPSMRFPAPLHRSSSPFSTAGLLAARSRWPETHRVRKYSDRRARDLPNVDQPSQEEVYTETFGRLATWTQCLENDALVDVRIRHHEHRPVKVQFSLLAHAVDDSDRSATLPIPLAKDASSISKRVGLDLTPFETTASMMFLFWLYNRRVPRLQTDCDLLPILRRLETRSRLAAGHGDADTSYPDDARITERDKKELYNVSLIEAWRLGSALGSARFMNDIMQHAARLLELEEALAERSREPAYSAAIAWARRAYDAMRGDARAQLRDFAVDVAAKRVYDVGANGATLTLEERKSLSGDAGFAAEVFASLGGQIGTRGVRVGEFARDYLVRS